MSAALRLIRGMLTPRITLAAFVLLLIPAAQFTLLNDSPFALINKATTFCLVKRSTRCQEVRWTTGNRLFSTLNRKCIGAQGKSEGSEVSLYDCDDKSPLQMWECRNDTLLALKGTQFFITAKADESISLSRTVGPNSQFTIQGTSSGACTRTYRELYTIEGNAFGKICMFPFLYKDRWFSECTTFDTSTPKRAWCAVGTKYENEQWGYCPTTSTDNWARNLETGAYYQLNTQSVLTQAQAEASCKQQGAALLSVNNPSEQAFVAALLATGKHKLWIGLVLDPEHGWQWSNNKPFRYLRWSSGNPLPNPGHNCAFLDSAAQHTWQSSSCTKKLGYICYKDGTASSPVEVEQGFCGDPWTPYNGHCFHLHRELQTWSGAQKECRKEGGDLVNIRNVEDQSFVISQLGYASTDELWIGLNDIRTEGLFDWSDHTPVTFTSWEFGKPAVATEADDCVLIRGENGNWADRWCNEKHGFICMKQSDTEQTAVEVTKDLGCKYGWKRHGSYCYFVGTERKTFEDAKDDCASSDSYLADVSNGVDNAFLVSLVGLRPEKYFWLGLSNMKNIDEFVWTSAELVRFTHWNAEMPGYQQGCVAMTTGILAGLWDLLPCTNTEKYICKHLAEGAVLTPVPPTQSPPKCEEGWIRVGTRNVCAKFFTGPRSHEKTWFEARDYCRAIGGDLLSIHSDTELRVGNRGRAWIGLHIPEASTGFAWSDGSAVNYQHWMEGEPNNHNNDETCVEFRMYHWDEMGSWNDANCDSYNDWICQIRAGMTPKPPPNDTASDFNTTDDGWLIWKGKQYYINRMSMSMEDARHYCKQRHGDLVSITTKDENTFLWKQVSRSYGYYYIGLSVDLDGSLWWMDGSSVGIRKWDENQPNTEAFDHNCVYMTYYMGFWTTTNCGQEAQSICKRGLSIPINATVAPTVAPKGGCPLKWTKFDTKCYSIISTRQTTWEEARRQCITMGGNLASVPSRRVQAFLIMKMSDLASTDLWIGLNSLKQDGFYWADGKKKEYTNWGQSKYVRRPGTFYKRWNEEDCVMMGNNPSLGIGQWYVRSCNDTNGFICIRDLDPNIYPDPEPSIPNTYVSLGNDSIKVIAKNLTWEEAKKQCENEKANLASLRKERTQAYVDLLSMNLKAPIWIGLNKQQTGGYFRYVDGWHLNYASWAEGEPQRDLPCVYVDVDGKWKTAFCNRTMYSVCMQSTDIPPTESTIYPGVCPEEQTIEYQSISWLPFRDHCYLFMTEEIQWADAASSCVRHGGTLVSINDPAEQEFLKSHVEIFQDGVSNFWIGLYKTHQGTWKWLDKTVLDYTNWATEEPDDDYGEIGTSDGAWRTGRRWHDSGYICETPKVMPSDDESKSEPHGSDQRHSRVRTSLIIVMVIAIVSSLMALGFFLYKRSPRPLPTFDNPLYFGTERSQPDVVDTNKLIENAEVENTEPPIIAL